jgi:endonuclease/exonuclease/phosphatase family metal-dependent hydrolase
MRLAIATLASFVLAVLAATQSERAAAPPAIDGTPVDVGTFNIRYANPGDGANAWSERKQLVYDMLKDGDFWGLQEALPEQVAELRSALPAYGMLVRSRERDETKGEACPILYRTARWEMDPADQGTFWLSETPAVPGSKSWDSSLPRIATFARFREKSTGRGLYVFNVHLDHQGSQARLEGAKLVAARIAARAQKNEPVVLVGDFNCGPSSPPIRAILDDKAIALVDAWRAANPQAPERGSFNGWAEACNGERIDFVLVSNGVRVESASIDDRKPGGRWPSDHAAVRARLALPR